MHVIAHLRTAKLAWESLCDEYSLQGDAAQAALWKKIETFGWVASDTMETYLQRISNLMGDYNATLPPKGKKISEVIVVQKILANALAKYQPVILAIKLGHPDQR